MKYGLESHHLTQIAQILSTHKAISQVLLFGSRSKGTHKRASDIDLALKGEISLSLIATLKNEFEESDLPFFFDIVDYAKAQGGLKDSIDQHASIIYEATKEVQR
ncbi:nucleotidyltransferase domain-containing protein [Helicobacter didelphidarum]|uniref:Nucleotidyltransferase domain-containing protein n=1 Tax=Helicobacter didelphidarum TaxID=2040648 RepID=A0A3D8IJF6_9HELI|nr:nucleotidyltransferase domain-containing protein [Helicobacter didelphidarum]RDU65273.1 nucleotidyltransferase domain-containing protein [Helicobacter didelphidarum]